MPRKWEPIGWSAFQIRTPTTLKQRLVSASRSLGQSQQSIIIAALEAYLERLEHDLARVSREVEGGSDG
ncbi:MAG: ribbon-helix-helix domain-containing protein [Firmicutes bacterium]|nr:hypothetical protein [Alicyclobacillaceae bacterium]MCL6497589.1 ribbon-helix-helix domain-containing protein [Bacillota bacterium]